MTASRQLDVYDIAYLAGGPERVVDTAVVALVESGRVRVHTPGELAAAEPGRSHPVEGAVMDAVGTRGHRSVDIIRWRTAGDERLAELGWSLAVAGLLRRRLFARTKRNGPVWWTTPSGRQALLRARQQPPTDAALHGGSAVQVALHGREALPEDLRTAIFVRPRPPAVPGGRRRRVRGAGNRDIDLSSHRTQQTASGGADAFGPIEGGAGDGGGL
jgi:hypothetical protein